MFKRLRLYFLLFVLAIVGIDAWLTKVRSTDWDLPLRVVIYPINADASEQSENYIDDLSIEAFSAIDSYMNEEAAEFGLLLKQPIKTYLAPIVKNKPPTPSAIRGNILQTMWWSLKMRYWATQNNTFDGPPADIKVYVLYHDPQDNERLAHSLGLEKGLIGVVNAFAHNEYTQRNNVVITHEMLHTLGATDKYDLNTGQPIYPDGYAEPDKEPRFPQQFAELMSGTIPTSPTESHMPNSLQETIVLETTAREIGWVTDE